MAASSKLSAVEISEATKFITTATHIPSGNIVSAHKIGNSRVIIRDTYMDDKNIKGFERALESCHPYTEITITRN